MSYGVKSCTRRMDILLSFQHEYIPYNETMTCTFNGFLLSFYICLLLLTILWNKFVNSTTQPSRILKSEVETMQILVWFVHTFSIVYWDMIAIWLLNCIYYHCTTNAETRNSMYWTPHPISQKKTCLHDNISLINNQQTIYKGRESKRLLVFWIISYVKKCNELNENVNMFYVHHFWENCSPLE